MSWVFTGNVANFLSTDNGDITDAPNLILTGWCKHGTGEGGVLVSLADSSQSDEWVHLGSGSDLANAAYRRATYVEANGTTDLGDSTWHFLTGEFRTYTIGGWSVWTDGTDEQTNASATQSGAIAFDTLNIGRIGDSSPSGQFTGLIDRIAIWTGANSASSGDLDTMFASLAAGAEATAITPPTGVTLYAYWVADDQSAGSVANRVGGTNFGALTVNGTVANTGEVPTPFGTDTTPPTLQSATIPTAGTSITLAFDETVSIGAGGSGGFTLSLSGGACTATYSSGDGTSSLVYTLSRTVGSTETGTISYTQPGNGIEDAAGNDLANISSDSVTNNSTQDTIAPSFSSATIPTAGTSITITFNEAVTIGSGGNGGVALTLSGGACSATYSSGSGSTDLVYSLGRTVASGETGTIAYTQPGDGFEDAAGNDVATFSGEAITNNSTQGGDTTAPTLSSATIAVDGGSITLAFDETVAVGAGGSGGFALDMTNKGVNATYSSGSGSSSLVYTLDRTIVSGETGSISYTQPGNGIEDTAGNDLANIASASVTNNSTDTSKTYVTYGGTPPGASEEGLYKACVDDVTINTTPGTGDIWEIDTNAYCSYDAYGTVTVDPAQTITDLAYRLWDESAGDWVGPSTVTWAEEATLSGATFTATSSSAGDLAVTTDVDTGTIYWAAYTTDTEQTTSYIVNGTGAADNGSIAVSSTGEKTDSASGLVDSTTYYIQFTHYNSGSYSAVVVSNGDTTDAAADTTPAAFSFTDITDAALSTVYESEEIIVQDIDPATGISATISGAGEYAVDSGSGYGAWTNGAGTVYLGDSIKVRITSSASKNTAVGTELDLNGVTDTFSVTTAANIAPVIDDQTYQVYDGLADGAYLAVVNASDADNASLVYSITAGNTNSDIAIDSATGVLSVAAAHTLDIGTTSSYSLTVQVDDGEAENNTDTATVLLSVIEQSTVTSDKVLRSCFRSVLHNVLK